MVVGVNVGTLRELVGLVAETSSVFSEVSVNVETSTILLGLNVGTSSMFVRVNDRARVSAKNGINIMKSRGT